jgi:hypothetical protein
MLIRRNRLWLYGGMCVVLITSCSHEKEKLATREQISKHNYSARSHHISEQQNRAYQTQQLYGPVNHQTKTLYYSASLSNQISQIPGVNTAMAMLTDHHAYIAVLIDNTVAGTKGKKRETNNIGTTIGIYNPNQPFSDAIPPGDLHHGVNNSETSVHHDYLTHAFKQVIAEKVRITQPYLRDVFISANQDFVNQMNRYVIDHAKGLSFEQAIPDFQKLVEQVFGTELTPLPSP